MAAVYSTRIARLERLERLLPRGQASVERCPDGSRLLDILSDAYGEASHRARRRALQRDLRELLHAGRIETANPGRKPLRYRRLSDDPEEDPLIWEYSLRQVRDLAAEALPERRFDRLWQRILTEFETPLLDESSLRIIPDTLRLLPVELSAEILSAVIESLAAKSILSVFYEDARGTRGSALLHPQALVQRGPIPYLFALKNDETQPVRMYALHRMLRAEARVSEAARRAQGFDLDQAIAGGRADFGQGILIDVELRVRGYLEGILRICPLAANQRIEDEPEGSEFLARVWARVPSTGQLLRWLLGAGDNLEVVGPPDLRRTLTQQATKMAAIYEQPIPLGGPGMALGEDPDDPSGIF